VFCLNESNKGGSKRNDFTISGSGVEHDKKKSSIRETTPLTLPSPTTGRGEKGNGNDSTAPLTFVLSRKGREDKGKETNFSITDTCL
jgi:hypothetical protein